LFFPIFWTYLRFPVFFVIPFFLICDIMYCCGLLRSKCRCVAASHVIWVHTAIAVRCCCGAYRIRNIAAASADAVRNLKPW
jgi:hypothetical protein